MRFPSPIYFALILALAPFLNLVPRNVGGASRTAVESALQPTEAYPVPLVQVTLPPPTARISPQDGWKLIYANGPELPAQGSLDKLIDAIRHKGQVGFAFGTFDGTMSGVCKSASIGKDGEIDCEAEIWCNQPNDSLPDRHGHTLHLRSTGAVTYAVITLNEVGDHKILALGDTDTLVAWYLK